MMCCKECGREICDGDFFAVCEACDYTVCESCFWAGCVGVDEVVKRLPEVNAVDHAVRVVKSVGRAIVRFLH